MHNEELHDFVLQVKYYYGDQLKEEGPGGAYVMHGEGGKCVQCFGDETGMKDCLEDLGLGWRIILKWVVWKDVRRTWTVGLGGRIILKLVLWKDVRRAWAVGLGGRIILKWVLWKDVRRAWTVDFRRRIILKWTIRKEVWKAWTVCLGGRIILKWSKKGRASEDVV
jgi:hypothetical protein